MERKEEDSFLKKELINNDQRIQKLKQDIQKISDDYKIIQTLLIVFFIYLILISYEFWYN